MANEYRYGQGISDSNPLPVKIKSASGDDMVNAVQTFEKPLYIVDYQNLTIQSGGNEITFDPQDKMFRLINTSTTDTVYYGFEGGETNTAIPLFPRGGSPILNDQGMVYLYANASTDVVVHARRLEVR